MTLDISKSNENFKFIGCQTNIDAKPINIIPINPEKNKALPMLVKPEMTPLESVTTDILNEISAIIISNTSELSRETLQNIQKHQKGGLSGKPIEKKSNLLISKFYNLIKGKIKISGVGGVDSGKAAYDKFLLGADYVQLYTGMVFQGPNIAGMIKKDLKELLIRDGVKNFTEIVGNKTVS